MFEMNVNQPLNEPVNFYTYVLRFFFFAHMYFSGLSNAYERNFVSVDDTRRIIHLFLKANSARYDTTFFSGLKKSKKIQKIVETVTKYCQINNFKG